MAERRENSVLFSLRELRTIEEDRVRSEEEQEKARVEAERRAREDEIRRARDAEEAKVRAEQDRVRQEQDAKERVIREEQLRLQESERRAQIEAAAKLEQARIEAEARARMDGKKFPTGAVVGGVLGLIVVAGIVMGILVNNHNTELKRQQAEATALADKVRKEADVKLAEERHRAEKEMAALQAQLEKSTDEAEKAKIRAAMQARSGGGGSHSAAKAKSDDAAKPAIKKPIKTDTSDPLGGLPGL